MFTDTSAVHNLRARDYALRNPLLTETTRVNIVHSVDIFIIKSNLKTNFL